METLLKTENLEVYRGKRYVLKGVSCSAGKGEVLSLIGANGSGKSTLLKTILGILPKASGTSHFEGKDLDMVVPRERAKLMSYMAQENDCRWPLSVRRVVALGRMPHQGPFQSRTAEDEAIVERVMEKAGVAHLADRNVMRLSGGERHRVLFARALASDPKLLFADEPTAGLDPYHQLHLMELFRKEAQQGRTIVVVLHDLGLAARFSDRIVLLKEGQVIADGTPEAVMTPEILAQAYAVHARSFEHEGERVVVPWSCREGG